MKMKLYTFSPSWSPSTLAASPSDTVAQRLRAALQAPERHEQRVRYVRETVEGHLGPDAPHRLVDLLLAVEVALAPRQGAGYESTRRTLALDAAEVGWHRAPSGRAWDAAIEEAVTLETAELSILVEYLVAARDLVGGRDRNAETGLGDVLALCMTCIGIGRLVEQYVLDGAEDDFGTLAAELVRTAQWCSDAWSWLQGAGYGPSSLYDRGSMRGIRRIEEALGAPVEVPPLHDRIIERGVLARGSSLPHGCWDRLPAEGLAWCHRDHDTAWILEPSTGHTAALVRLGWRQVPCEVFRAEHEAAWRAEQAAQAQASAEREAADEAKRAEILAHPAHAAALEIAALEPRLAWPRLSKTTVRTLWDETETFGGTWGQTYWHRVTPAFWHAVRWLREQLAYDVRAVLGWPGSRLSDGLRALDHAWIRDHARLLTSLAARTTPCAGLEVEYAAVISAATEIADRLEALAAMLPAPAPRD